MEDPRPCKKVKMETRAEAILGAFNTFRDELDEHHARRERVIKKSRDITDLSKKIIVALHRVRSFGKPLEGKIAHETEGRLKQIADHFASIAPDLTGVNGWRYQWQISPGIQEFIEAISFKYYLETTRLITIEEVRNLAPGVIITEPDYLLGLFDLTGELMRYTITSIAAGNNASGTAEKENVDVVRDPGLSQGTLGPIPSQILQDMRELRVLFEALSIPRKHSLQKHFHGKLEVMCNSVDKIEIAAFEVLVRGSELPNGWTSEASGAGPSTGVSC